MNTNPKLLPVFGRALLALLVLASVPALLEASGIGFRNDSNQNIYVQGSSAGPGGIKKGPLLLIKPGQAAWDVNLNKGTRNIAIYDASNRILFQTIVPFDGITDQFYGVMIQGAPNQPPRAKLKELPLPNGGPPQ